MTDRYEPKPWEVVVAEYKDRFEKENPTAFKILEVGGVHPDKSGPMPNPYLDNQVDEEKFGNIGTHCIEVAICANKIVDSMLAEGAIDSDQAKEIVDRSLVHDANKRFEVFRRKAKAAGKEIDVYTPSAYQTMHDQVAASGIDDKSILEYVKRAGKETGHGSLVDFVALDGQGEPVLKPTVTLEEMVVHLSDDSVASPLSGKTKNTETKLVTTAERMDLGNFPIRYPFLYKEGFGFDAASVPVVVKDISNDLEVKDLRSVKTYAEWQQLAARLICEHLKSMIDRDDSEDPEEFIKKIINQQ